MDTEQYEEAVRDYEKVYQTEKTKGETRPRRLVLPVLGSLSHLLSFL